MIFASREDGRASSIGTVVNHIEARDLDKIVNTIDTSNLDNIVNSSK